MSEGRQEAHGWKERLMAVVPDQEWKRGRRLARAIIHPRCYARAHVSREEVRTGEGPGR